MTLKIVQLEPSIGARIEGVNLSEPIDEATFQQIRQAFYDHGVIYFRGSEISDEDHIRFTSRFGPLRKLHLGKFLHATYPEIFIVSNIVENGEHVGQYDAGVFWHTDGCYLETPHAISALRALEVPEQNGRTLGDTYFASTQAAYEALPESMKKRLEGLTALQSYLHRFQKAVDSGVKSEPLAANVKQEAETTHPVIRIHPVTKKKCLYVNQGFTVRILGMPEDESEDLLAELTDHCIKPEFQYRHNWRVHDLVMWDNCSLQHKAIFDYALPLRRKMHRTTVISSAA